MVTLSEVTHTLFTIHVKDALSLYVLLINESVIYETKFVDFNLIVFVK